MKETSPLHPSQPALAEKVASPSYHKACEAARYTVIADEDGVLDLTVPEAQEQAVVIVTSERVPQKYLEALRALGYSYVCVGRDGIDRKAAALILRNDFHTDPAPLF